MAVDLYGVLRVFNPVEVASAPADALGAQFQLATQLFPNARQPCAGCTGIDFNENEIALALYNPESGWVRNVTLHAYFHCSNLGPQNGTSIHHFGPLEANAKRPRRGRNNNCSLS